MQPTRTTAMALSFLFLTLGLTFSRVSIALAFPNEPAELRGIAWGKPVGNLQGMRFLAEEGELKFFERENDALTLEDVPLDRIVYGFHKERFFSVLAYFSSLSNFLTLKDTLTGKHGEPFRPAGTPNRYFWSGEKVELLLVYDENTMTGRVSYFYKPIQNQAEGKQ